MRLLYNPKYLGNRMQAWKSFLVGSMMASSFILFTLTENPAIYIIALAMMAGGFVLFSYENMSFGRVTYLYQNFFSVIVGLAVSLAFHFGGFLPLYLGVIMVLVLATWLHKFATPGKAMPGERPAEVQKPVEKLAEKQEPEKPGKEKPLS
jgi:K+ transporter